MTPEEQYHLRMDHMTQVTQVTQVRLHSKIARGKHQPTGTFYFRPEATDCAEILQAYSFKD